MADLSIGASVVRASGCAIPRCRLFILSFAIILDNILSGKVTHTGLSVSAKYRSMTSLAFWPGTNDSKPQLTFSQPRLSAAHRFLISNWTVIPSQR